MPAGSKLAAWWQVGAAHGRRPKPYGAALRPWLIQPAAHRPGTAIAAGWQFTQRAEVSTCRLGEQRRGPRRRVADPGKSPAAPVCGLRGIDVRHRHQHRCRQPQQAKQGRLRNFIVDYLLHSVTAK